MCRLDDDEIVRWILKKHAIAQKKKNYIFPKSRFFDFSLQRENQSGIFRIRVLNGNCWRIKRRKKNKNRMKYFGLSMARKREMEMNKRTKSNKQIGTWIFNEFCYGSRLDLMIDTRSYLTWHQIHFIHILFLLIKNDNSHYGQFTSWSVSFTVTRMFTICNWLCIF